MNRLIEPDGMADDFGRETVASVEWLHRPIVPDAGLIRQCRAPASPRTVAAAIAPQQSQFPLRPRSAGQYAREARATPDLPLAEKNVRPCDKLTVRKDVPMSAAEDWARDFFAGLFVDLWLAATTEQQTRREADFLEKVLRLPGGASIVDLACGGGRHCLELSARGYRLTGVDISPDFLAVARVAAAERGLAVTWEQRAMHDLPWEAAFDGAICMGNSLGGLDDAGIAAFLRAVARTLKPASRLVLDTGFVAESLLPNLEERHWGPVEDILYLAHRRYDHVQGRLNIDYTFIREGRVEKKSGFGRVYTYKEFCRLIEEAGFDGIEGYASAALEPYRLGSPELLLVATKKGS